ncbi:YdcF family protein [Herbaspirillum autotrophicum]|uniref:YdcF family protein n=1 Tax=Herbaspirillum autotrophicum TaxID=180195 RepID=UPI00067E5DF1|nr:YdcF family protein [Herbaspirillum autotrophicum]
MTASFFLTNLISSALLFPLNLILPCALGLLLRPRWPRTGLSLSAAALALLVIFSTNAGAWLLIQPLEQQHAALRTTDHQAQAIVVLSGARTANAPEYDNHDIPGAMTLIRLQYGARLHRLTQLPLLVSGGKPGGETEAEALLMARYLEQELATPVRWQEDKSNNTAENAALSAAILRQAGVTHILLVTDAIHMPRAVRVFRQTGIEVTPAPTHFLSRKPWSLMDFLPGGEGLRRSNYALHEWLGLLWYKLRYDT